MTDIIERSLRDIFAAAPDIHLVRTNKHRHPIDDKRAKAAFDTGHHLFANRLSLEAAIEWIEDHPTHLLGIAKPVTIGIGILDQDTGGNALTEAVRRRYGEPVAIIPSNGDKRQGEDDRHLHIVYPTDTEISGDWCGGQLRIATGYAVMWDIPKWAEAIGKTIHRAIPPVDLSDIKSLALPDTETPPPSIGFEVPTAPIEGLRDKTLRRLGSEALKATDREDAKTRLDKIREWYLECRRVQDRHGWWDETGREKTLATIRAEWKQWRVDFWKFYDDARAEDEELDKIDISQLFGKKKTEKPTDAKDEDENKDIFEAGDTSDARSDFGKPVREVTWLIPGLIPTGALTLLASKGGVGKSTLMSYICLAMLQEADEEGINIVGDMKLDPIAHATSSLFISYEDDFGRLRGRYRTFYETHKDRLTATEAEFKHHHLSPRHPLFESWHNVGYPNFTSIGDSLKSFIEDAGFGKVRSPFKNGMPPKLIVVDPVAAAFGGNENDRREVRKFAGDLDRLAVDTDTAIVLITHPPKSEAKYSGSTDWINAARAMVSLEAIKPISSKNKDGVEEYEWSREMKDKLGRFKDQASDVFVKASKRQIKAKLLMLESEKLNDGYPRAPIPMVMGEWGEGYGLRGLGSYYASIYHHAEIPPIDRYDGELGEADV